jgi:hypothetical protein
MRLKVAIAAFLSIPSLAWGQELQCGPMDQISASLAAEFQEVEIRQGVSSRGHLIHLFVEATGATWTIIGEKPGSGVGYILDSGTGFTEPPMPEPDQGTGL